MAHKDEDAKHEQPKHEPKHEEAKFVGVLPQAEPARGDEKPRPTIGVRGEPIEDGERDPDTIAEEQRRRSEEYEGNLGRGDLGGRSQPPQEQKLPSPKK